MPSSAGAPPEADRYDVLEKIGQGSFGIIRKVRRKSDGHILCRKEISYTRMSTKEREQLQAELQILKGLRHSNIVAYYEREHIKASGDLHIYMEYCEQGDLGMRIKELKRSGQMASEDFVWSVFAQLVTALYRCHYGEDPPEASVTSMGLASDAKPGRIASNGRSNAMILHRDLKPENIFLGADASVKLGDFGLSKIMASHDFASTYVGTPFYMSPEICAAEQYSLHSDIWAFGCIMYELCSKSPPFNAKTHLELIQKIRLGKVDPLSSCYSDDLKAAISKCLRVNPTTRPDTVQLLNMPMVKLKRKELEIMRMCRQVERKEKDLERRLRQSEADMRIEIDNSLRREWEVKARLEIDRQVQIATQQLWATFDLEVQSRVQQALVVVDTLASNVPPVDTDNDDFRERSSTPDPSKLPSALSSFTTAISTDDETDELHTSTDMSDLSLESPTATRAEKVQRRTARTPFGRAQTMFVGSPMDIQMADPSPAPIASLGLSPRQDTKHRYRPSRLGRNLFSNEGVLRTDRDADIHLIEDEDDDEDNDFPALPSPTRSRPSNDPFKALKSARPNMARLKTAPTTQRDVNQHQSLFSTKKENIPPASLTKKVSNPTLSKSPSRRLSKLPSANNLLSNDAQSPTRKTGYSSAGSPTKPGAGINSAVPRPVSRKRDETVLSGLGAVQGKTLVELSQARTTAVQDFAAGSEIAGPVTRMQPCSPTKTAVVWDPERDEMPSPFIVRGSQSKPVHVLAPALGGPGFRHLR